MEEPNDDRELPRRNMRRRAGLTLMRGSEAAFFNLCRLPDAFESPTWPCQRVINNAYVLTFYWGKKIKNALIGWFANYEKLAFSEKNGLNEIIDVGVLKI